MKARLALAAVLALGGAASAAEPTSGPNDLEEGLRWIRAPYQVRAGDDPAWAAPALDDRGWTAFGSALMPGESLPGWAGIAWFRLALDVPPELADRPVPLHGQYVGATEIYVDGELQAAIGDPRAVLATGSTPVDFRAERPRWIRFAGPGRHLVAVRFASRHVAAMHHIDFPAGFQIALGDPASPVSPGQGLGPFLNALFIGATVALVILHLLLFLFHRDRRENLHYALAALGVAVVAGSQIALRFAATATQVMAIMGVFGAAICFSAVMLLRFYYAVFTGRLPRIYWPIFAVGCAIALTAWTAPKATYYVYAGLLSIEQARVLVTAVIRRLHGAWIIAAGGVLWLVGGALQMLGDLGVLPLVRDAYLFGFFALLVSISIYLARDIARDKADLGRAMERYRTIFETTGTGTVIFDDAGVISLANDEWAKLSGHARAEIEGRMTWKSFFSDGPRTRTYEAQLRDRGGRLHDGVVTIAPVPGTRERVGSFLDLTDLKRVQRQMIRADKMAALGQVIAGVAHEINNPNNFIHFNLPILRRYVDAMRPVLDLRLETDPDLTLLDMRYERFLEDLFKLIENMEHGSQRITAIVSDLRAYVRGSDETELRAGSIARVVEQVMAIVGKQVRKMVKRFDVEVAPGLPPVKMNAGRIEQVLTNLVINAGQAADKDDSWVKLTARPADAGAAVEILVEDNGAGIPPQSLEQIFEPFYTTKGRDTGSGLGLSISQQIVEEHGGRIEVTSVVGEGACFHVRLPAAGRD